MALNPPPPDADALAHAPRAFEKYAEIDAIIRRLPVRQGDLWRVAARVDQLAIIGLLHSEKPSDGTAPAHFRSANATMIRKELAAIRSLAKEILANSRAKVPRKRLARLIGGLHEPTITALSESGSISIDGRQVGIDWHYFTEILPRDLLDISELRDEYLQAIINITEDAERKPLGGQRVGRPPDNLARVVSVLLARMYKDLTGLEQTITIAVGSVDEGKAKGPYLKLVVDIFLLLNIDRAALSFASRAARGLRGSGRKK
jgi:hypothetical protein